jgi:hypothetical protein
MLHLKSGLVTVKVGLADGQALKLAAEVVVIQLLPLLQPLPQLLHCSLPLGYCTDKHGKLLLLLESGVGTGLGSDIDLLGVGEHLL